MAGLTPEQAAQELLRRQRMRESLIGFAQNIDIPGVAQEEDEDGGEPDPGKIWHRNVYMPAGTGLAAHHIMLMQKIQQTMQKRYGRLMVFMPPGSAKSTYCTVIAPTWYMGNHPGHQIILGSYNLDLAKKQGNKARRIIEQEAYQSAFNCQIDPSTNAKELWAMTNGAEYMSSGLLGGLTGNRAQGMVIDDPIRGRADAKSPAVLEKTYEAWRDDAQTRLLPGGWVVWVQTRWDYADPAGMILPTDWDGESGIIPCRDGMDWEVLCLKGKIETERDAELDPLGRKVGEYLWPQWFDEKFWRMYEPRPNDPDSPSRHAWSSLFQQNPKPDKGGQFERDWVQWYDLGAHPEELMLFTASDYALSTEDEGDDPDYTEHGVGGLDKNGHLWLVDWWWGQQTPDVTIDALIKMAKRRGIRYGFGEKGLIQKAIEPQFRHRQKVHNYRMKIEYLPTISEKVTRFMSFRAMGADGRVHIPDCPWGHRLVDQLADFPQKKRGYHDDGVDVCSLLGRGLEKMKWSKKRVTRVKERGVRFGTWEWLTMDSENEPDYPDWMK